MSFGGGANYRITLDYDVQAREALAGIGRIRTDMLSLNATMDVFSKAWSAAKLLEAPLNFNAEMEKSRIIIAGVANATSTWTGGMSSALSEADIMMKGFREDAKASVATTADFVGVAKSLTPALLPAGKTMADVRDITREAVTASTALGIEAAQFSSQLGFIVSGMAGKENVTFVKLFAEEFGRAAKAGKSFTEEFNKKPIEERIEMARAAMARFTPAAKLMENSWSGVVSTMTDTFEITLGDVVQPLFEAIKEELKGWLAWIEKNKAAIQEFVTSAGERLRAVFYDVRDAIKWIVDHKDSIIAIGIGLVGLKGASAAGGAVSGLAGMLGAGGAAGAAKGAAGVAGMAGPVGAMVGVAILGIMEQEAKLAEFRRRKHEEDLALMRTRTAADVAMTSSVGSIAKNFNELEVDLAGWARAGHEFNSFMHATSSAWETELSPETEALIERFEKLGMTTAAMELAFSKVTAAAFMADPLEKAKIDGAIAGRFGSMAGSGGALGPGLLIPKASLRGFLEDAGGAGNEGSAKGRGRFQKITDKKVTVNVVIKNDFKHAYNPDRVTADFVDVIEKYAVNPRHPHNVPVR